MDVPQTEDAGEWLVAELTRFAVRLGNAAAAPILDELANHPGRASQIFQQFPATLSHYLRTDLEEHLDSGRILSPDEFVLLAEAVIEFGGVWASGEYLRNIPRTFLPAIRDQLSDADAQEWGALTVTFARQLDRPDLLPEEAIRLLAQWCDHVRHLLNALGTRPGLASPTVPVAITERLDRIEKALAKDTTPPEWYSTAEFAELVGKAEFTVREWCRTGRVHAKKQETGRGLHQSWAISHREWQRYRSEGLLPSSG